MLIRPGEMSMLVGPVGSGKTFLAVELARCVSRGEQWLGWDVVPGKVCYLAREGVAGMQLRLKAIEGAPDDPPDNDVVVIAGPEHLYDLNGIDFGDTALIIVDPVHVMADTDLILDWSHAVRAETKAHVVLVMHRGDGKPARGTLYAECGTVIRTEFDGQHRHVSVLKDRLSWDHVRRPFLLRSIQVGVDPDGAPITTCVVAAA